MLNPIRRTPTLDLISADHLTNPSTWSPWYQTINSKELNMTALQGWIVIGLLVLIVLGIVGIGAEIKELPYLWRTHDVGLASFEAPCA
jgi:hypothetical protein